MREVDEETNKEMIKIIFANQSHADAFLDLINTNHIWPILKNEEIIFEKENLLQGEKLNLSHRCKKY